MAVFPNLLQGIDLFSKKWDRKVKEIIHDQQSQFEKILTEWHEMYSKAAVGVINWPMEEPISFRRVTGSKFIIKSSKDSPGIQAIDIVLWLFKKLLQGERLPPKSSKLMRKRQLNPIFQPHSQYVMISLQINHNHIRIDHGKPNKQTGSIKDQTPQMAGAYPGLANKRFTPERIL